jgi:hypothetical protein
MIAGPSPARSPLPIFAAPFAVVLIALIAGCGGGGGGDNGNEPLVLHLLVVNGSKQDATVGYTAGGEAQPDKVLKTCTDEIYDLPVADPFTVTINGAPALQSSSFKFPLDSSLIAEVDIDTTGKVSVGEALAYGPVQGKPAADSICIT